MFNKMKRKMFFRLAVTCLVAVSALIACTKDYESDINELQNKVDGLSKKVDDLNKLITDGYVITDVSSITGGTRVTLSNGDHFDVTNGKDGNDGEDGKDGTTWKIGDNGNWWADKGDGNGFVDSGKPSRGVQGPQGDQGPQGVGIANAVLNDDYTLTITLTDGTTFKTPSIRGAQGPQGEIGPQGPQGVGIANAVLNDDYSLTITLTDGTTFKTTSIRGEQGPQGLQGPQGVGIESTVLNDDYTLTITYTDGTSYTTPSIRGAKGEKGTNGDYFKPCTEKGSENYGKWIKVNGETLQETVTEDEWLPKGTLTAVWDESTNTLTIANVEGRDEDDPIVIDLNLGLNSLAVIPELWDATLGMPMAQVYAILPSAWETFRLLTGNAVNYPRLKEWNWPDRAFETLSPAGWEVYFWCALYSSYLGATGQKNAAGYSASWDINSGDFGYNWRLADQGDNLQWEAVYADLKAAVDDAIADLGKRLDNVSNEATWLTRQPPVSALNIKYRVNPASANISDYKFRMIDRTLTVSTKADGDKVNHAVTKLEVEKAGKDQLNATGYIDYFKYWADQPTEWFLKMLMTKQALAWYYWDAFDGYGSIPNKPRGERDAMGLLNYIYNANSVVNPYTYGETAAIDAMKRWQEMNGLNYKTIVALEASKNGQGAEAVVSDYTNVKLDYVYPVWTAYRRGQSEMYSPASSWPIAPNWGMYFASGVPSANNANDYLVVGQTYDVASHMRFADLYYGRLEDLGFEVKYDYYVFQAANNESYHDYGGAWADAGGSPSGETENNYGGWDKVNVTADGKVTVKEDAEEAIGKVAIIVADASIKNEALGTYYNSAVAKASPLWWDNGGVMYDEFIGHYILLIVPDSNKTKNVTFDLGDIDYLTLTYTGKTPAPLQSLDPRPQEGRSHEWDDALDMDMEGFNAIYTANPVQTSTAPAGFSASFQRTAADMFNVGLSNQVALGPGSVTYTFNPSKPEYPVVCYTIKWNVVIDWTDTEPILNDNYILFNDAPEVDPENIARFVRGTGVLAETDITPDPATKYATPNRKDDAFDTTKFPYVDSIVTVKGKEVDGVWKPQSSIKEHIREYGSYLAAQPNIANMSMAINFPNSQKEDGAEIILRDGGMGDTYANQDIKLSKPFAMGEPSRDYVVDIKVTLANGAEKVVKAYIVRFICPFYIEIADDIELYTHTADWCSDRVLFNIRETGTNELLVFWDLFGFAQHVTPYAQRTYGSDVFSSGSLNAPKWHSLADTSFGNRLLYGENSGWFYWCNMGTDLQFDKRTTYKVTQEISGLAYLTGEGEILIHKTADSPAAHINEGHGPEIEPTNDAHPTWSIIFDNE